MKRLSEKLFMVPLSASAHRLAQQFCQQHSSPQKAKQVYLNTLAVSAVEFYLGCMDVETDWRASQSYDPIMQSMLDVADLALVGKGKLECRPLLPDTPVLTIPPEVRSDSPTERHCQRLAYLAVQLSSSLQEATLLGFAPAGCQRVAIDQLRSLDTLLDYLEPISAPTAGRVNLSQWLENLFETGWQSLSVLTGTAQPRLAATFRNSAETAIRRAKLIDLGVHLGAESVALLVAITPLTVEATETGTEPTVEIWVQIHPTGETRYLPSSLSLSLLSETGEALQTAESRHQDNYIQLKRFRGTLGECFDIKVAFGEICTTESFVI
ncbi:MAG: DUF1822 family protein [Phormidesmis sp.]